MTTVDRRTPAGDVALEPGRLLPPAGTVGLVALGGAIGALARTALSAAWPAAPGNLPWSTLFENVTGAFALGWLLVALGRRFDAQWAGPLVATGVLGSYTTFATVGLEVHTLAGGGAPVVAVAYLLVTAATCLLAAGAGILLGRRTSRIRPTARALR